MRLGEGPIARPGVFPPMIDDVAHYEEAKPAPPPARGTSSGSAPEAVRREWRDPAAGLQAPRLLGVASFVVVVAGLSAFGGVVGPLFLGLVLILTVAPMASVFGS